MNSPIAWRSLLEKKEYSPVVKRLQHMVAYHRLFGHCSDTSEQEDIPYDAFLYLLEKGSFDWYLKHPEMSDLEIDRRINSVNLNNFLSARSRKRNPEEWRLARRVSILVTTSSHFRRFFNSNEFVRSAERVYGLSFWPDSKFVKDPNLLPTLLENVAVRSRSNRQVGCTGDADLVISNEDLHSLIVEVFEATDSPCKISVLRMLVFSKLTSFGNYYVYFEEAMEDTQNLLERLSSEGEDADARVKASAEAVQLTELCDKVLDLQASYYRWEIHKEFRVGRMFKGLQLLYFDSRPLTQLAMADELGVSDSLIGEWKSRFEADVIALGLSLSQLRLFNEILQEKLLKRIALNVKTSQLATLVQKQPLRYSNLGRPPGDNEALLRGLDSTVMSKLIAQLPEGMAKLARLFYLTDPRPNYAQMALQLGLKSSKSIFGTSQMMKQRLVVLCKGEHKSAKPKWSQGFNDRFSSLSEEERHELVMKLSGISRQVTEAYLFYPPGSKRPTSRQLAERFGRTKTGITSLIYLSRLRMYDLMSKEDHS